MAAQAQPESRTGVFVRRSEFDDHPAILSLIGDESHVLSQRYGRFDVTHMIENATLGITAVDGEGRVIGYAAFFDFPALTPSIDAASWPEWLEQTHGHPEFTPHNTLWLCLFLADHLYEAEVADNILRTAFTTLPEMDVFLLALPHDVRLFAPMRSMFEFVPPLEEASKVRTKLHACPRGLYIPNLLVRTARVEDHDDLVPVFNSQSEVLSERYGEFFLAEVIGAQDGASKALVAETDGRAVGLLAMTSDIDVRLLDEYFELDAYDGLLKPDPSVAGAGAPPAPLPAQPPPRAVSIAGAPPEPAAADGGGGGGGGDGGLLVAEEAAEGGSESGGEDGAPAGEEEDEETKRIRAEWRAEQQAAARQSAAAAAEAARRLAEAEAAEAAARDRSSWRSNAFCITLFCMDESFESRAADFLRPAFALFPALDYCVITLPHVTAEFQLLYSFAMVQPREEAAAGGAAPFGHVLYVFHRAALTGQLRVRPALRADEAAVGALVESLPHAARVRDAVAETVADAEGARGAHAPPLPVVAYVVECQAQVVGVATVQQTGVDVAGLKMYYQLEDYVLFSEHSADGHAQLHDFIINPIFAPSARFVLKELFRKARRSVLYLQLQHDAPVPDVAREFVQVRPRRPIQLPPHLRAAAAALATDRMAEAAPPDTALHFLTRKLISEPKIQNNVRIVVVGASDTSLAFLETLLTVPYLHFTSVTLISPDGLPDVSAPQPPAGGAEPGGGGGAEADGGGGEAGGGGGGGGAAAAGGGGVGADGSALSSREVLEESADPDAFLSTSYCFTPRELRQLALGTRVRVVRASIAEIDRTAKAVELAGGAGRVPYDVLLLAPPLHDQTLQSLSSAAAGAIEGAVSVSGPGVAGTISAYLGSAAWARRSQLDDADVFVYGGTLSAYCSLQALLHRGVPASKMCLLLPPDAPPAFPDPRVEARVHEALEGLGIAVLAGVQLRDVRAGIDGAISTIVVSEADADERELPAALLLTADTPDVDDAIFRACNANSLVYDGRLVIDAAFRTSDQSIYAAGPLTKFSRRYRGGMNLEHYDKRDVGVKVAHSLLPLLDPLSASAAGAQADALPSFTQPRAEGGVMPGGLIYMQIARPAVPLPYDELIKSPRFGRELVTGQDEGDYCCVRIDRYDTIDAVTYLGATPIEVSNLKQLISMPQMYANRLVPRYDEGLVPDLPDFLRQNWAMCLFHDRFADFRTALKGELLEEDSFSTIVEDLRDRIEAGDDLPTKDELRSSVQQSSRQLVEKRLVEYLQTNQNHLFMYLVPSTGVMRQMEDKDLVHGRHAV